MFMEVFKMKKLLILIAMLFFAGFGCASADANVNNSLAGRYISPTVNSYIFDFNVQDGNFVAATHDANIDIYLSASAGAFTNALVNDGNADTYCGAETNYASATRNCTYTFNADPSLSDGNYFIDINFTVTNASDSADTNSVTASSAASFYLDETNPNLLDPTVRYSGNGKLSVSWNAITASPLDFNESLGYRVYYGTSDPGTTCNSGTTLSETITVASDPESIIEGLTTNTDYYICVNLTDEAGNVNNASTVVKQKTSANSASVVVRNGQVTPISAAGGIPFGQQVSSIAAGLVTAVGKPVSDAAQSKNIPITPEQAAAGTAVVGGAMALQLLGIVRFIGRGGILGF